MSEQEKKRIDLSLFVRMLAAWGLCAFALLACASALYAAERTNLSTMGYASSLISFMAAAAAGIAAGSKNRKQRLLVGLISAFFLIAVLLIIGLLIKGRLNGSAVLSMCCFTITGCLLGALIPAKRRRVVGKRGRR